MAEYRLFIGKYAPQSFTDIQFNQAAAQQLIACAQDVNLPHMIIKGGCGSGRKTFANLFIKEKYHLDHLHINYQSIEIKNTTKTIDLQMLYSDYHYQIEPSLHSVYDRLIVQGFIKDILQTKPICHVPYHMIIITNADKLTLEAQQSLRRTLEKNISNCRFIFLISQEGTLIEALISRCIQIRLAAPTIPQMMSALERICAQEHIRYQSGQLQQLVVYAQRNMAKAHNLLQYVVLNCPQLLSTNGTIDFRVINVNDKHISGLVSNLLRAKCPHDILQLRTTMYELLVQCVEPIEIMKRIFQMVFDHLEKTHSAIDPHQLISILVKCEDTLKHGSKPIYHLESFLINIMLLGEQRAPP